MPRFGIHHQHGAAARGKVCLTHHDLRGDAVCRKLYAGIQRTSKIICNHQQAKHSFVPPHLFLCFHYAVSGRGLHPAQGAKAFHFSTFSIFFPFQV